MVRATREEFVPAPSLPLESGSHSPGLMRRRLLRVLNNREELTRSAKASFRQHSQDGNVLLLEDLYKAVQKICINLQIPPVFVEDPNVENVIKGFTRGNDEMTFREFFEFYYQLLSGIQTKYYPAKTVPWERANHVGDFELDGEDIRNFYDFGKRLGKGSFGVANLVKEKRSQAVRVCKTMRKDVNNLDIKQIRIEIDTLKLLDHPNVLKVYDIYNNNDKFYVIMENCRGDEFGKRFAKMFANNQIPTEAYVNEMMHQILSAVNYIHAHKVVHKDLKPENILFIDESPGSEIKIIDFGLAEHFSSSDEVLTRVAGSPHYMAPEVFGGEYDKRCDLWSVGCIMYYISTWRHPFIGRTREETAKKICKAKPDYSLIEHLSPVAQDFLRRLLVKNPKKRMDAPTALAHEWFERFRLGKRAALRRDLTPAIRQNLEIFTKFPPLKAALVNLMAHQLPHSSQVQHITQVFHHLDSNEDGVLSEEELSQGLTYCRFPTWSVVQILRTLDIDDSRSVSYTEFLAACYTWMDIDLKHLWSAFMRFDRDGNGKIELQEFKEIMGCSQHGRSIPEDKVRAMFREIDVDNNGVIEWKELEEYISS